MIDGVDSLMAFLSQNVPRGAKYLSAQDRDTTTCRLLFARIFLLVSPPSIIPSGMLMLTQFSLHGFYSPRHADQQC